MISEITKHLIIFSSQLRLAPRVLCTPRVRGGASRRPRLVYVERGARLIAQQAAEDLVVMVDRPLGVHAVARAQRALARARHGVHEPADARVRQRHGAHGAGLQGHVGIAAAAQVRFRIRLRRLTAAALTAAALPAAALPAAASRLAAVLPAAARAAAALALIGSLLATP